MPKRALALVRQAHEDGRVDDLEAATLVGFLLLTANGVHVGSERTIRRRRARLRELGVPERDASQLLADELGRAVERGDLSAEEATVAAGRYMLACARISESVYSADDLAQRLLAETLTPSQRP